MSQHLPVVYNGGTLGIVDPDSGECFAIADAPEQTLAAVEAQVAQIAADARNAKSVIDDELGRRMGRERNVDYGPFRVESGYRNEWDPHLTWRALSQLCEQGLISPKEVDDAMPEQTKRRPDGRALNALLIRVSGEDPAAAQPLAQARSSRRWFKVEKTAVDSEAVSG